MTSISEYRISEVMLQNGHPITQYKNKLKAVPTRKKGC